MTQHLATFNKTIFTKGSFSGTKCTRIVYDFGRGSARTPLGEIQHSPELLVDRGGDIPFPFSFTLYAFGVLMSGSFKILSSVNPRPCQHYSNKAFVDSRLQPGLVLPRGASQHLLVLRHRPILDKLPSIKDRGQTDRVTITASRNVNP